MSVDEHNVQSLHLSNSAHSFPGPVANVLQVNDAVQSFAHDNRDAGPWAVSFVHQGLYIELNCSYSISTTVVPKGQIHVNAITVTTQKKNMFDSDVF